MRLIILLMAVQMLALHAVESPKKMNVLFIAVDDLNHWVGYTGRNPQTKTPHIDRLAKMGVAFTSAHCVAPVCNPSRAALLSGIRPNISGCYDNSEDWRKFIPEGYGLSQAFRSAGYRAMGAGKIYHGNNGMSQGAWDDYFKKAKDSLGNQISALEGFTQPLQHDLKDEDFSDYDFATYCIEKLGQQHDKPFFLACGFQRPHLPWVVPKKYYDLFPLDQIELPPYQENDLDDLPPSGKKMANPAKDHAVILENKRWKEAIQSYLACCAYTDMNIGRILDALEKSAYQDNTIIVLWGDHGWHLGEKHHWRKFTLWEEATRAPLIWVVPGITKPNQLCHATVDFMSIYPTLCAAAGIPIPAHVQGENIINLLANPAMPWDKPALTTYGFNNHAVRTNAWRYIRYDNGDEELYDRKNDPYEWTNLASKPDLEHIKTMLARHIPTENKPHDKTKKNTNAE
jgi:arylsulfatase A-like enzyme